ncbi:hypothetical protein SF148580_0303 [Shigella flexneri 1485-80]|nr:hypothetical protein SF148580_0303 [Shigella flexneri 1485-80]
MYRTVFRLGLVRHLQSIHVCSKSNSFYVVSNIQVSMKTGKSWILNN